MSAFTLRRADREMTPERMLQLIQRGYSVHLATVSRDGSPYCTPFLYVWMDQRLYIHGTNAIGHFRTNIGHEPRVCFAIGEQEGVFDYGRFECDSGLAYRSVMLFGTISVAEDRAVKQKFCEMLLRKYGNLGLDRPKNFFPRLDLITVYELSVERMTGKEQALPPLSEQWPAMDRTKTPNARPPG